LNIELMVTSVAILVVHQDGIAVFKRKSQTPVAGPGAAREPDLKKRSTPLWLKLRILREFRNLLVAVLCRTSQAPVRPSKVCKTPSPRSNVPIHKPLIDRRFLDCHAWLAMTKRTCAGCP
jgi:hypothetical protein